MNALLLTLVFSSPAQIPEQKVEYPLPSDMLMAASYLDTPTYIPTPKLSKEDFIIIRDAIQKIAIDREILDPRETRYVLNEYDDFEADLNLLRKRNIELADAPKIADCSRFPDRRTTNALIKFNRDFKKTLEERMLWEFDRHDILSKAIQDNEKLYRGWDALRDAQCDFYYVTVRRMGLKKVKDAIGEENYMLGKMGDNVPAWCFSAK